jgi:hypothetical protein
MSQALFSTEGLITLVRAYAVQDTQCVMRSSEDGYWALARELERIGDEIRVYVDGMVQHGYAEGRKDEQAELSSVLPGVWYMDPPDGGAPTILEQLQRQADDATRFVWLTTDHGDPATREKCRELIARLPVMSYAAAKDAIDTARRETQS